jgi:hypothetical protein
MSAEADSLEMAAYHEAGHYAVRNYFGIEVTELSIDGEKGNCRFRVSKGDLGLLQNIAGSFAGRIAEDRMGGFTNEAEWKASGDYASAFDCALRLSAGDKVGAEMLLQWAWRRTEKLVEKLWPKIHKVAFALLEHEKLSGDKIDKLLRAA